MDCFSCGHAVVLASGDRVGFREACASCGADLHVCMNCRHHDAAAHNECREPGAETVRDRGRANRCEYFAPGAPGGRTPGAGPERDAARRALDALFRKP